MTPEEYKQLDDLLGRLFAELDYKRFCIIPQYVHSGVYIGLYDHNGEVCKQGTYHNIEEAVKQLNKATINAEKGGEG